MADERRTDRGIPAGPTRAPAFDENQRLWLLERDLDLVDDRFDEIRVELQVLRKEVRLELGKLNVNLWRLVGVGFAVLTAVLAVLVTVIASSR